MQNASESVSELLFRKMFVGKYVPRTPSGYVLYTTMLKFRGRYLMQCYHYF